MTVTVRIPTPLRGFTGGAPQVRASGGTVGEVLADLVLRNPDLRRHLFTDEGRLRNFVNAYLNDEDVRHLEGERTPVAEGDSVTLVPSIAGGAPSAGTSARSGGTAAPSDRSADAADGTSAEVDSTSAGSGGTSSVPSNRSADVADGAQGSGPTLTNEEIRRYARHLILPEVAMRGQKKLKGASVLLVGAGGLGSPLGLYLAAAGVGRIGIVDFDVVDETNLQRQVLHGTSDVGRPKLDSARDRLRDVNPHVRLDAHPTRLTGENALELVAPYDVVVDGTDNFPTRYLVNDACALLGKPNVYGSIFRFEGQVSVFDARRGPCYRCLFREPPPPGLVPSCAEGGVLGVLPGIIGSLQALETIKLILGEGDPLVGRLLLFDALTLEWRELKLRKDPECPVCGAHPTVTELIDYEEFCGVPGLEDVRSPEEDMVPAIGASELKARLDRGDALDIVDVREPHEWEICNLGGLGARLIPQGAVPDRMSELDSAREIVLVCRSGKRSARVLLDLHAAGFRKLLNLDGGMLAWSDEVDPEVPKY